MSARVGFRRDSATRRGFRRGPILEYMACGAVLPKRQRVAEFSTVTKSVRPTMHARAPACGKCSTGWKRRGIKRAIFTRNSRKAVVQVMRRCGLTMDAVVAREDAAPKPSPEPVFVACRMLDTTPDRVLVVGDFKFDIEAGPQRGRAHVFSAAARSRRRERLRKYRVTS